MKSYEIAHQAAHFLGMDPFQALPEQVLMREVAVAP